MAFHNTFCVLTAIAEAMAEEIFHCTVSWSSPLFSTVAAENSAAKRVQIYLQRPWAGGGSGGMFVLHSTEIHFVPSNQM